MLKRAAARDKASYVDQQHEEACMCCQRPWFSWMCYLLPKWLLFAILGFLTPYLTVLRSCYLPTLGLHWTSPLCT